MNQEVKNREEADLCHARLGHVGRSSIEKMVQAKMLEVSGSIGTKVLELIHSDICGPFLPSIRGYRYFITFIDDFTRMVFVDLMKARSGIVHFFETFLKTIAIQRKESIQSIRGDNALENILDELEFYLKKKKVNHQSTVPYCPQQNGTAEWMNRTLQDDLLRCMLDQAGLPDSY